MQKIVSDLRKKLSAEACSEIGSVKTHYDSVFYTITTREHAPNQQESRKSPSLKTYSKRKESTASQSSVCTEYDENDRIGAVRKLWGIAVQLRPDCYSRVKNCEEKLGIDKM